MNTTPTTSTAPAPGHGFVLLPLRTDIRQGLLPAWPDAALSVLIVLACHEDALLYAWPSWERIAHLGGLSRSSVCAGLEALKASGHISIGRRRGRYAWHGLYRLLYPHYGATGVSPAAYLTIAKSLIHIGIWAHLSPADRRLYLVALAHADERGFVRGVDPVAFATLAGISPRRARSCRQRLECMGLLACDGDMWLCASPDEVDEYDNAFYKSQFGIA